MYAGSAFKGRVRFDADAQRSYLSATAPNLTLSLTAAEDVIADWAAQESAAPEVWLPEFAVALSEAIDMITPAGEVAPGLEIILHAAPPDSEIDFRSRPNEVGERPIKIEFALPASLLSDFVLESTFSTISHEIYHVIDAVRGGLDFDPKQRSRAIFLRESAAGLFGHCASLLAVGYFYRWGLIDVENKPPGEVFDDRTLRRMFEETAVLNDDLTDLTLYAEIGVTTILSSLVGSQRLIYSTDEKGRAVLSLCDHENLYTSSHVLNVYRRFAFDQSEAAPLDAVPLAAGQIEKRNRLDAINRWRKSNGLSLLERRD